MIFFLKLVGDLHQLVFIVRYLLLDFSELLEMVVLCRVVFRHVQLVGFLYFDELHVRFLILRIDSVHEAFWNFVIGVKAVDVLLKLLV